MLNLTPGQLLVIAFLFLTTLNCLITYFCSSVSLKVLEDTGSYPKAIAKIRMYDKYILTILNLLTSVGYVILAYFYFLDILEVSDYFLTLSILLGFVFSLLTTFFSRLCYCYACNVLLKTKLNEYECFIENFFYLTKIFLPLFIISFVIPTIYLLPIMDLYRRLLVVAFIVVYLSAWVLLTPYKNIFSLNARKIKGEELRKRLSKLFIDNDIKKYELYYWDSSRSNESNAMISGFFKRYLFVSSTIIDTLNERELEAIVLHELGHVKCKHLRKILVSRLFILCVVATTIFYTSILTGLNIWIIFALIALLMLIMGINLIEGKKYEEEADLFANSKGYGQELISALKKIGNDESANVIDDFLSSHPNTNERIDNINKKD